MVGGKVSACREGRITLCGRGKKPIGKDSSIGGVTYRASGTKTDTGETSSMPEARSYSASSMITLLTNLSLKLITELYLSKNNKYCHAALFAPYPWEIHYEVNLIYTLERAVKTAEISLVTLPWSIFTQSR